MRDWREEREAMDGVHRSWEAQRGIPRLAERWIGVSGPIASSGLRSVCLKRRGRFPEKETAPVNARDSVDDQGRMLETGGTMQRRRNGLGDARGRTCEMQTDRCADERSTGKRHRTCASHTRDTHLSRTAIIIRNAKGNN